LFPPPRLFPDGASPGLDIRRRLRLLALSLSFPAAGLSSFFFFAGFLNCDKSILSPEILGPVSFLY